jgi:hypothetical protein
MLGALELLILCLTVVGVKVQAAAGRGGSSPVSSSSIAQWVAAIWSGETVGWAITWRRMTRRLLTNEPVEPARGRPQGRP